MLSSAKFAGEEFVSRKDACRSRACAAGVAARLCSTCCCRRLPLH